MLRTAGRPSSPQGIGAARSGPPTVEHDARVLQVCLLELHAIHKAGGDHRPRALQRQSGECRPTSNGCSEAWTVLTSASAKCTGTNALPTSGPCGLAPLPP